MKSVLGECGTCTGWLRCSREKKDKQIENEDPCPEWKRLATEGIESGWC